MARMVRLKSGVMLPREVAQARFDMHVVPGSKEDCWFWRGNISERGYGKTEFKHVPVLAHRLSYRLYVGPLGRDKVVMHTCDVPPCVNPAHLRLGTQVDNIQDMHRKGRGRKPMLKKTKLTGNDVREIKRLRSLGNKIKAIAEKFKLSSNTINRVLKDYSPYLELLND